MKHKNIEKMLYDINVLIEIYQNYGKQKMMLKLNQIIKREKLKLFESIILQDRLLNTFKSKNIIFSN